MELIQNLVAIVCVIVFTLTFALSKVWRYLITGILLSFLGVMPILYAFNKVHINPLEFALFQYFISVFTIICGRGLVVEGIKGKSKAFRITSIVSGVVLVIMSTIPALHSLGAITFDLSPIPDMFFYGMYTFSGIILAFGSVVFKDSSSSKI